MPLMRKEPSFTYDVKIKCHTITFLSFEANCNRQSILD